MEGDEPRVPPPLGISGANTVESCCLEMQHQMGDIPLPTLNIGRRPIAHKYREGRMKSTLKRV